MEAVAFIHELAQKVAWHFRIDYHSAQDMAQEACLSVWDAQNRGIAPNPLTKQFLVTVLTNKIRDLKRKPSHRVRCEELGSTTIRLQMSVEEEVVLRDIQQGVWDILDKLTPVYRNTLSMRLDGMKYQEIAETLGVPIGTVKSRIDYARRRFTALAKDRFSEEVKP